MFQQYFQALSRIQQGDVTGRCASNNQLIIARHHSVKHFNADHLREKGFECFEEIYGVDSNSRYRST